jgi:hypothetical protein
MDLMVGATQSPSELNFPQTPSSQYPRKIFWDVIVNQFGSTRQEGFTRIIREVSHLFSISNHWLSFFNIG